MSPTKWSAQRVMIRWDWIQERYLRGSADERKEIQLLLKESSWTRPELYAELERPHGNDFWAGMPGYDKTIAVRASATAKTAPIRISIES